MVRNICHTNEQLYDTSLDAKFGEVGSVVISQNRVKVPCCSGREGGTAERDIGRLGVVNSDSEAGKVLEVRKQGSFGGGTWKRFSRAACRAGINLPHGQRPFASVILNCN